MTDNVYLTLHVGLVTESHDVLRELAAIQRICVPAGTNRTLVSSNSHFLLSYFRSLYGQNVTAGAVTGSRVGWPSFAFGSVITSTITPLSRNFSTLGMAIITKKAAYSGAN